MQVSISPDLLRGHTDTIILNILRHGDSYGYEIYKTIIEKTGEQFELKEATLYSSIRRLEQEHHIESYWGDETQGGRRKYYRITESGRALYTKNRADWEFSVKILKNLLGREANEYKNL